MKPIVAISTPPGIGAIALIRLSGEGVFSIAQKVILAKKPLTAYRPRTVHYAKFIDPETKEEIDDGLFWTFRAPNSYTGENMVELTCHGGRIVSKLVLEAFIKAGASLAEPGEFTKRAFLNGKLDLVRARGVLDIIEAKTRKGVHLARRKLDGLVSKKLERIEDRLLEILKNIEASINFAEDVDEIEIHQIKRELEEVLEEMDRFIEDGKAGRAYLFGAKVAIIGRPNVGKSTLFNALLGKERAIVTEIPGTTRDVISEEIILDGLPVKLLDTAGLRETSDVVEKIGVEFAKKTAEEADLAILVVDATQPDFDDEEQFLKDFDQPMIIVVNKIDLTDNRLPEIPDFMKKFVVIGVSAKDGTGVAELRQLLADELHTIFNPETGIILSDIELSKALMLRIEIAEGLDRLNQGLPIDIVSDHLMRATAKLREMLGHGELSDEILNRIFADFCIGK